MKLDLSYVLTAVAVMAVVTYLPRMIPLTFFRKKITNRTVRSALYYMPYAVLSAMTFPAILSATSSLYSALAGLAAALALAYARKGLLTVAVGATGAALVVELLLGFLQ